MDIKFNGRIKILLIDDDDLFRGNLKRSFSTYGLVHEGATNADAKRLIENNRYDIAFFDYKLEDESIDFNIVNSSILKGTRAVMLTSINDDNCVKQAYDINCYDYQLKTPDTSRIVDIVKNLATQNSDTLITDFIKNKYITQDEDTIKQIKKFLKNSNKKMDEAIFIEGPSGVGKTLLANILHSFSKNKSGPFVHINCSEFSDTLLNSELFGHEKGAYTDAKENRIGKLKLADNGTLFLDEVGTMSMRLQSTLLLAIESKQFRTVGGIKDIQSNFQLICATNENINDLLEQEKFRSDFHYRIYKDVITLKPLKERRGDIPLLFNYFLKQNDERRIVITDDAMECLKNYDYPANVRDVESIVYSFLKSDKGKITLEDLPSFIIKNENRYTKNKSKSFNDNKAIAEVRKKGLQQHLNDYKEYLIDQFININDGNIARAMRDMNYHSGQLYRKCPKN
ncbi:MAG: sigma-54-dependent Fis family transcriptional regulator [Oligoflexia bacterium]|nr:sigma-54-dependent Fis family transcriptional regulator [Oligoflexia bacterium]